MANTNSEEIAEPFLDVLSFFPILITIAGTLLNLFYQLSLETKPNIYLSNVNDN